MKRPPSCLRVSISALCASAPLREVLLPLVFCACANAQDVQLTRREWTIGDTAREALLHVPATANATQAPIVFVFHGHGGNMRNAARSFHIHTLWPDAIVVYPQGLNTPGRLTDPEGKLPGWQPNVGDQGDRDVKFFEAVLA